MAGDTFAEGAIRKATLKLPVVRLDENAGAVCREILEGLPEWFGVPQAIEAYAQAAEKKRTVGCLVEGKVAGFAVLRHTSPVASEIYVMAVRKPLQRRGIGRRLVDVAAQWTLNHGRRFLLAKTLGPSVPSDAYASTRRFYEAMGFLPLEELTGVWPCNPCLMMLKLVNKSG